MENEGNVIQAYVKTDTQKIVQVGQTKNLSYRDKQHRFYDPFNINNKEYDYPLSRGIRKQGQEMYQLIILEDNIPSDKLNEKERYYIQKFDTCFHGYNQTLGGSAPNIPIFSEEEVNLVIEMLKDESYSYNDIVEKTGFSLTHIYNINIGARRKRSDIEYPIRKNNTKGTRGIKFSQEECKQIHEEILNSKKTFKQIAKEFECCDSTIRKINNGLRKAYILEGYNYPLRK